MSRLKALAIVLVATSAAGCSTGLSTASPVDTEIARYQALQQALDRELEAALAASIAASAESETGPAPPGYPAAARLWTADSRLGPWLLASGFQESRTKIAALRERGVRQADVAVAYPILSGEEARSGEYRHFYASLATEIRRQGLALRVVVGPQYRDAGQLRGFPLATQCGEAAAETFARHAAAVAALMEPDYLSLDLSPAALSLARGCESFATPEAAAALALDVLRALGLHYGTRVGIAARAAEDTAFFAALLASDAEFFLDVSVFRVSPEANDHLDALQSVVEAAQAAGRDVAVGGYWLQKTDAGDDRGYLGLAYSTRDAATDTFDLWAPVDQRMHQLMRTLSKQYGLLYASAYRSELLFAYLPTREVLDSDLDELNLLRRERSHSREARIEYLKRLAAERREASRQQSVPLP